MRQRGRVKESPQPLVIHSHIPAISISVVGAPRLPSPNPFIGACPFSRPLPPLLCPQNTARTRMTYTPRATVGGVVKSLSTYQQR